MARQPMVTRTITTTKAKVLCIDLVAEITFTQEVVIPRTYKDEKAMLKKIAPLINSNTIKVVHVQSVEIEETLYGMTEQEFIAAAKILPHREKN